MWLSSFVILFLSLLVLRILVVQHFEFPWSKAYQQGLLTGAILDAALALVPFGLMLIASAIYPRIKNTLFVVTWVFLYLATLANTCYILFFRKPLDLAMIHYGAGNLWDVRGMILHFLAYPMIDVSLVLLAVGLALPRPTAQNRISKVSMGLLILIVAQLTKQSPIWLRLPRMAESPLSQSAPLLWWKEWGSAKARAMTPDQIFTLSQNAPAWFERMRSFSSGVFPPPLLKKPTFPYALPAVTAPSLAQIRTSFGLPQTGKINVILLFLESNRAYEFANPLFSKVAYPNLNRILQTHGLFFSQAYSSADYTVQGQFATLCSTWDRMEGRPTYTTSSYLKISCLPQLLVENGYQTFWMNPYDRNFSGKYVFESNHGMQKFFDGEFFKPRTPDEAKNQIEWGVSDQVFYRQAFEKIQHLAASASPFFVHLLNVGTHGPWHRYSDFPLPADLTRLLDHHPEDIDYLTAVRAEDSALNEFFESFFKSPLSKNTLIVLSSDHGNGMAPGGPSLTSYQRHLLWPRTLLAVIGKNLKPGVIRYPVHQIDIAPLIAAITGIQGKVTWLGRNPLSGSGTPWVKEVNHLISYRTDDRLCEERSGGQTQCWMIPKDQDPLLMPHAKPVAGDPTLTHQLKSVVQANEAWIDHGGTP